MAIGTPEQERAGGWSNGCRALTGATSTTRPPLDDHDVAILRLLVRDARMSQRRIAREVGMSAPAVADRIARLERTGVIRGYRADLDRAALGFGMVVYVGVVAVQGQDQTGSGAFPP